MFRTNLVMSSSVIFKTNQVIIKTNQVIFRRNTVQRYGQDILKICLQYVTEIFKKFSRYVPDKSKKCPRYVPDMSPICQRYVPDMLQICSRYVPDMSPLQRKVRIIFVLDQCSNRPTNHPNIEPFQISLINGWREGNFEFGNYWGSLWMLYIFLKIFIF